MDEVCQGIVLYSVDHGEADRIITLLTAEGKMRASLRGAKKPTAKLRALSQVFAFGEFSVATGNRGGNIVTGGQLTDSFFTLAEKPDRYFYGCLFLEVADRVTDYADSTSKIFIDLLRALQFLTYSDVSPEAVCIRFILRIMGDLGYAQKVSKCVVCGAVPTDPYFDAQNGGLQCENCHTGRRLSPTVAAEIRRIACAEWADLEGVAVQRDTAKFLVSELELLLDLHFKSAETV